MTKAGSNFWVFAPTTRLNWSDSSNVKRLRGKIDWPCWRREAPAVQDLAGRKSRSKLFLTHKGFFTTLRFAHYLDIGVGLQCNTQSLPYKSIIIRQ